MKLIKYSRGDLCRKKRIASGRKKIRLQVWSVHPQYLLPDVSKTILYRGMWTVTR